jgi:hypothetical protein
MLLARWCALVIALLLTVVVACGSETKREIDVALAEWSVEPGVEELKAGTITFTATNSGTRPHELVIVKTDLPPTMLLLVDSKVDETKVNIAGKIDPFAPSTTASVELDLTPGKFVLLCNIVEAVPGAPAVSHYENGMYASLLLTQ